MKPHAPADRLNPVVILGTGRCGSTLLHQILRHHPRLAWLTHAVHHRPEWTWLNRVLLRLVELPLVGPLVLDRVDAAEPYRFWEHLAPGFSAPDHDLDASDVRDEDRRRIRRALREVRDDHPALLLKLTGWPRIGYLEDVLDAPRYIHIFRDGREVAASLLQMPWWNGREGPDAWRWGRLDPELERRWTEHDRSSAVLAGIQWEMLMDATEESARRLPDDRYTRLRYEDLCRDPLGEVRRVADDCGLPWDPTFEGRIRSMTIRDPRPHWEERLEADERRRLRHSLAPALQRYGYAG